MADEIRLRAQLSAAKSGRSAAADSGEISVTMSGTKVLEVIQSVGIAEEPLQLGDINPAANAHYWIFNLDTTNPIDLRPASGGTATTRIGPGKVAVGQFTPSVNAPYVIAITAPVDIKLVLVQA